jgi:arylsulfatase A-like enzyme
VGLLVLSAATVGAIVVGTLLDGDDLPSFTEQACGIPAAWLERTQLGHFESRSGQIAIIPRRPAYMASGAGGWSHSGPYDYLQHVPIVFYGPGVIPSVGEIDRPVTTADIAPTLARLMRGSIQADGKPLDEVADVAATLEREPPTLIMTFVWDGGGYNVLEQWPETWPNLARIAAEGVSYTNATVGSSPSVTPAVHTTLGAGMWPATHGITAINVRDDDGDVVDAFLQGRSGRFLQVPTLAELWDEQNGNDALVGMVGYEPWHLGMIGIGAEKPGGDKDDAVWLDTETNEWISNPRHYRLPESIPETEGLVRDLDQLDAVDGQIDRAWGEHAILDDPARIEETPAFITYHGRVLMNLISQEGYGDDPITDLLFTNFKQIDRVGHYFNMASDEVRDSVAESDRQLGLLVDFLDREVGRGKWVVVVSADHGQEYDDMAVDGYGINPRVVLADINERFGPVALKVNPTNVFLDEEKLAQEDVTIPEVARFLGDYRVADNVVDERAFTGQFDDHDRLFAMAIPARMLPKIECGPRSARAANG